MLLLCLLAICKVGVALRNYLKTPNHLRIAHLNHQIPRIPAKAGMTVVGLGKF